MSSHSRHRRSDGNIEDLAFSSASFANRRLYSPYRENLVPTDQAAANWNLEDLYADVEADSRVCDDEETRNFEALADIRESRV